MEETIATVEIEQQNEEHSKSVKNEENLPGNNVTECSCPSPHSEDPLQKEKERDGASPYLTLFDSSTNCSSSSSSSSSSSTASKSKCGDCDRCRAAEALELDEMEDGRKKREEPVQIWPIRPDAKWKVRVGFHVNFGH